MGSILIGFVGGILSILGYFALHSEMLIILGGGICVGDLIVAFLRKELKSIWVDILIAVIGAVRADQFGLSPAVGALFFVGVARLITAVYSFIVLLGSAKVKK
jgi:hypothetical protein